MTAPELDDGVRRRVFVGPASVPELEAAVVAGGGELSELGVAEAIVYFGSDEPEELRELIHDRIAWVQLPHAGVEPWQRAGLFELPVAFTCSAGLYGRAVAEHVVALMLAAARNLPRHIREPHWQLDKLTTQVEGATALVIGGGGITSALLPMLTVLGVRAVVVAQHDVPGADEVVPREAFREWLPRAEYVVLAAPSTPETRHLISSAELGLMRPEAWLINVGRGDLVATSDLVTALRAGTIAGAGLDVVDPEPLPEGHELWQFPNVIVTSHSANPERSYWRLLAQRTEENVREFSRQRGDGEKLQLAGMVRSDRGY
ncbi:NAD(P)-dependent oxidoreductase [Leifsonia poae]|uniref:NAD(P)-dependent oxidoreductase n=1 Tax=Leifsonia poae TaxID=110933 RepID=UPI003D679F85